MKIGNVRNYNRSFGVKIDSYTAKGMRETAKNIIEKNGENSEEFRQLVEDVKVIAEKYPDTTFFYDMDYDVTRASIWLRPDNPVANMKCIGAFDKENLFSQEGIHYIAKKINESSGRN